MVVVLTALDTECDAVRALLRDPQRKQLSAGTIFELGGLDGVPGRIALAEIGVGNRPPPRSVAVPSWPGPAFSNPTWRRR